MPISYIKAEHLWKNQENVTEGSCMYATSNDAGQDSPCTAHVHRIVVLFAISTDSSILFMA